MPTTILNQPFTVLPTHEAEALAAQLMSEPTDGWRYEVETYGTGGHAVVVAYDDEGVKLGPL